MRTAILVTGGAGYVGSHACKALAAAGYLPVVYDNLSEGHRSAVRWGPLEVGDLLDETALEALFQRHRFSAVLHFAARAYVGESVQDPGSYYRNNVTGTVTLLDAMRRHGVAHLVFSSSCATYGIPARLPISEQEPQAPINPYGASKQMVERVLGDYAAAYGMRFVALRYFNAAGADPDGEIGEWHDPETHLIPLAIRSVLDPGFELELFGDDYATADGTAVRDFIHVSDLGAAHVAALRYLESGGEGVALNLGTGRGVSVREAVAAVERAAGRPARVRIAPRRPGDPPALYADPDRAAALLGWRAERSDIDTIVADAWAWHTGARARQLAVADQRAGASSMAAGAVVTKAAAASPRLEPLPLDPALPGQRPRRICIVSTEFNGVYRNGGIGTANTSLGLALAAAGHRVTFLYTRGSECDGEGIGYWIDHYHARGVELVPLPASNRCVLGTPPHLSRAYDVYAWLAANDRFDVVHFQEHGGIGHYALQAKAGGLGFGSTLLCVGCHSATFWIRELNGQPINEPEQIDLDFMERESVRLADVAWSPSRYLARWMLSAGWQLPERFHIQQYVLPPSARLAVAEAGDRPRPVTELVFFGRLETRKGLDLFCDALDHLARQDRLSPFRVTFLGRHAQVQGMASGAFIARRSRHWPWPSQVICDYDQPQAMAYLRGPGRLAVMASPADNSPNTVYECLGAGVPFLACHSGGIPELIAPDQVETVCFPFHAPTLAQRLAQALREGMTVARPAVGFEENERAWVQWHEQLALPVPHAVPAPAITVVLVPEEGGPGLDPLLADLAHQDVTPAAVVLLATGDEAAAPGGPPRVAPSRLAETVTTPVLVVLGTATRLRPDALRRMGEAIGRGADLVTCALDIDAGQGGQGMRLFLGGAVASGVRENLFGDPLACSLARALLLRLDEAVWGHLGRPGYHDLFTRAHLEAAARQTVLPVVLGRRPAPPVSLPGSGDAQANLGPYLRRSGPELAPLLRLVHGLLDLRNEGSVMGLLLRKAREAQADAVVIYGAGEFFVRLLPHLRAAEIRVSAVVDRKALAGEYDAAGYRVTTLDRVLARGESTFVIASAAYTSEIAANIREAAEGFGIRPTILSL